MFVRLGSAVKVRLERVAEGRRVQRMDWTSSGGVKVFEMAKEVIFVLRSDGRGGITEEAS